MIKETNFRLEATLAGVCSIRSFPWAASLILFFVSLCFDIYSAAHRMGRIVARSHKITSSDIFEYKTAVLEL